MQGRTADDYGAPLFLAWQLTNRCSARCIACCEESGPDNAWPDELSRDESLELAARIVDFGIGYVAFGGGEPLGVPHCWEVFEALARGGVAVKLETDGSRIDDDAADRLAARAGTTRAAIRRSLRGHGAHERTRTPGAVRVRSQSAEPARDRRGVRPRRALGLRGLRHGTPNAHRPRRRIMGRDRM